MKFFGVFIVVFMLLSCGVQVPISKERPANNKSFRVDYLFEHDGCKVYRFRDNGHYVYFTNCSGEAISIANDSTEFRVVNTIQKHD